MKNSRSIDLSSTRFPESIAIRRTERGWSKADLAQKAGLSVKVIHQIELRQRDRFYEKTLMLVADALETGLEELLSPRDEPASTQTLAALTRGADLSPAVEPLSRRGWPLGRILVACGLGGLAVAVLALIGPWRTTNTPRIDRVGRTVQASSLASGKPLWSRTFDGDVTQAELSPWGDRTVLVSLACSASGGGRVLLLDGKDGATLWGRSPDVELAASRSDRRFSMASAVSTRPCTASSIWTATAGSNWPSRSRTSDTTPAAS